MYIESDNKHGISFTYHVIPRAGTLSKIDSDRKTIIQSEHRKCHTEGYTHGINVISIQLVISLIIIDSSSICTTLEEISDVISIWNKLESRPERLGNS